MKPGTDNKKLQVFPVNGIAGVVSTLCPCKRHEAPASKPKAKAVSSSHTSSRLVTSQASSGRSHPLSFVS